MTAEEALEVVRRDGCTSDAAWTLIGAFNDGLDFSVLIELIQSDDPKIRSTGVYVLEELNFNRPVIQENAWKLIATAIALSSSDRWERKVFLDFCRRSKLLNDELVGRIAELLQETDLWIRHCAITWVCWASVAHVLRMAEFLFQRDVETADDLFRALDDIDPRNRQLRAFKIGLLMKEDLPASEAIAAAGMEDSFTLERLIFFQRRGPQPWERMRQEPEGVAGQSL